MSPAPDPQIDDEIVDALSSLGNRSRLEILLALADAQWERQEQWLTMSFTELYDAVDIASTSQFSYHLEQLLGWFIAETPEGYRLTYGGDKIVRTICSGLYESTPAFDDVAVGGCCVFCGGDSLVATVDEERFVVRCRDCETPLLVDHLPRSQTRNRSPQAVVDSVGYRIWSTYTLVRGDVCPECYGVVDTAVDAHDHDDVTAYTLAHTCRECRFMVHMPLEVTAAFHPAAVGFLWGHGISMLETPLWEFFEFIVTETITTDVASTAPLEAVVEITVDDETLRLAIDDSFRVTPIPTVDY
ncbi:ArsR/SmtB family transcription factor [Natronorubrum sulfidifaciens]|uniref:ArsR family transcriptional regulator n=1 Tax=Natronorubrum sulfidifaciens JCM 14089 TaxID=1230460 RepID=L9W6S4_9EURY|nr:winged helix-turn-helix domain-containing protein [Natronorubrum sulfidifaciens]ELY45174.1 hypothetical protein C495_09535 [Natronorubrum sulfidifaciens JCM 14089]